MPYISSIDIRLRPRDKVALDILAAQQGLSISAVIENCIDNILLKSKKGK